VIGREVSILRTEIPLELNRVASRQRHHRLQPDGSGFRDMRAAYLTIRAPDFGRAVQQETQANAWSLITA